MHLNSKSATIIEKIMWIYLFANPFIDILTGVYICEVLDATELDIVNATFSSTPGLIVRMAMLLVFAVYILLRRDKLAIGTLVVMGLTFVASIAVLMLRGVELSLGVDVKYFVKFCYNIVLLFAYIQVFRSMYSDKTELLSKLGTLVTYTCIVYALGIIIPYIFGLGYSTYADRLGYRGCRGYFYSGNDVTAVFAVLFPVSLANIIGYDGKKFTLRKILTLLAPALVLISLLLIGSKTAFIAAGIVVAAVLVYCVFSKGGSRSLRIKRFLCFLLTACVIFMLLILIVGYDKAIGDISASAKAPQQFAHNESVNTAVFSGRSEKLHAQGVLLMDGGPLSWLFGIGRSTVVNTIEMDIFEVLVYYGILGAVSMLWIYVKLGLDFIRSLFKKFTLESFALFIGIGLTVGYLIVAGHVLFTVTSGQYLMLAIILSRIYFSDNAEQLSVRLPFRAAAS